LTLVEAARVLGVRTATLRAQIARGRLSATRRGRDWHVSEDELSRYRTEVQARRPTRASNLELLIKDIADHFERTAEWPETSTLQRKLVLAGADFDVYDASKSLDPLLGRIEQGGRAMLTMRGLVRAGSKECVSDFERLMRLAIARYHDPDVVDPTIASSDLAELGDLRVERVRQMLGANPFLSGGGGGSPESWSYRVSDDVHRLGRAHSIRGYLAAVDENTRTRGVLDIGPATDDWPVLEGRLRELGVLLERADSADDYQDLGRRSREIVGSLADLLMEEIEPGHPYGSNRKAMIDAYLNRVVGEAGLGDVRDLVRAALKLANHVTHDPAPHRAEAVAAAQAAVLLVRTLDATR